MPEVQRLARDGLLEIRQERLAADRGFYFATWNSVALRVAPLLADVEIGF